MPSVWRSRMIARSNSAKAPKMLNMSVCRGSLFCVLKVMCSLRKMMVAFFSSMRSTIARRSTMDRASRSILATRTVSPVRKYSMQALSCWRGAWPLADTDSKNSLSTGPISSRWRAGFWSALETRI